MNEEQGLARTTDPETSQAAARSVGVNRLFVAVLKKLAAAPHYGMTMNQVVAHCGLPNESITPRFRPMSNKGLIYDTGETRRNLSGRSAIVWKITATGLTYLERSEDN